MKLGSVEKRVFRPAASRSFCTKTRAKFPSVRRRTRRQRGGGGGGGIWEFFDSIFRVDLLSHFENEKLVHSILFMCSADERNTCLSLAPEEIPRLSWI